MGIAALSFLKEIVVEGDSERLKIYQGQKIVARDVLGQNRPLHGHVERVSGDINAPITRPLDRNVVNDNVVGIVADGDAIPTAVPYTNSLHDDIMRRGLARNLE